MKNKYKKLNQVNLNQLQLSNIKINELKNINGGADILEDIYHAVNSFIDGFQKGYNSKTKL